MKVGRVERHAPANPAAPVAMDLNTITNHRRITDAAEITGWSEGCTWLAGGTWLFSEPQTGLHTLIDMEGLDWPPLPPSADGLEIGATCKIADLYDFEAPARWNAAGLFRECCQALLASFKIWNAATVGGNVCLSLPAGAMITLTAALEGVCTLWPREGAPREVPVVDFVTGIQANVLRPGELLRSIKVPESALRKAHATRRFSLTQEGRSSVFLIGTRCPTQGTFILTITAATVRPLQITFATVPTAEELRQALADSPLATLVFDDPHGTPDHRQHLTYYYAEQIRQELSIL